MKIELDEQEIELTKKNTKAEELIKIVKKETEKVKFEKDKGKNLHCHKIALLLSLCSFYNDLIIFTAAEEEDKVKLIEEDVSMKQRLCAEDLEKAEPALVAAQSALDILDKVHLFYFR